jgi:hypothetical protein
MEGRDAAPISRDIEVAFWRKQVARRRASIVSRRHLARKRLRINQAASSPASQPNIARLRVRPQ